MFIIEVQAHHLIECRDNYGHRFPQQFWVRILDCPPVILDSNEDDLTACVQAQQQSATHAEARRPPTRIAGQTLPALGCHGFTPREREREREKERVRVREREKKREP